VSKGLIRNLNRIRTQNEEVLPTEYLTEQGAANAIAGTTGLGLIGALNKIVDPNRTPDKYKGYNAVLNEIAGTSGVEGNAALDDFSLTPPGLVTRTGAGFGETYDHEGYRYHYFLGSGTFEVLSNPEEKTVEVLYGAGGGSGGSSQSDRPVSGAGAGGVLLATGVSVSAGMSLDVVIGAGGAKVLNNTYNGAGGLNGTNTTITGLTTAIGGGAGGSFTVPATSGGSGAGGEGASVDVVGKSGTPGQGNNGGTSRGSGTARFRRGGSGGGAGGPGVRPSTSEVFPTGGAGANYSSWQISSYGIGEDGLVGGGGSIRAGLANGGGGRVRNGTSNGPADALVNTSGGGGGNNYEPGFSTQEPGSGGSGFAVFRWEI
jgi:hypothetical protein